MHCTAVITSNNKGLPQLRTCCRMPLSTCVHSQLTTSMSVKLKAELNAASYLRIKTNAVDADTSPLQCALHRVHALTATGVASKGRRTTNSLLAVNSWHAQSISYTCVGGRCNVFRGKPNALFLLQLCGDVDGRVAGLDLLDGHRARPFAGLGSARGQRHQLPLPLHDLILQEARHRRRLASHTAGRR